MNDENQPYVSGMFQQIIDRAQQQAPMIQQYLQQNPSASDIDMYMAARQADVSPLAIAMATNSDPNQIAQRYQQAEEAVNTLNQPQFQGENREDILRQIVKDTVTNKAIQGMLLATPLAPIAPFVPAFKPVKRLFDRWF